VINGASSSSYLTILINNILYGNVTNGVETNKHSNSPTYTTNLCTSAGTWIGLTGNPLYINTTINDFHIPTNSPAKDAALLFQ